MAIRTATLAACFASVIAFASHAAAQLHWGTITPKRMVGDRREWSGVLYGIPPGQSWKQTCLQTAASVPAAPIARPPDACVVYVDGVWGVWFVPRISPWELTGSRECGWFECTVSMCSQPVAPGATRYGYRRSYFCLFCRSQFPLFETTSPLTLTPGCA